MRRLPCLSRQVGLLLAALLPVIAGGCSGKESLRGDLVLILADRAPDQPSTLFEELVGSALTFTGPLDFPNDSGDPEGTERALLLELLTGKRSGQEQGRSYEWLLSLPQSAKLSGYRSLCVSNHLDTIELFGMEQHFDYGLFPAVASKAPAANQGHGTAAALAALLGDYEARGIDRGATFLLADLTGADGQLEPTLASIRGELFGPGSLGGSSIPRRQTLAILFTDPDSSLRAVIVGPDIQPSQNADGVAPRDFLPTLAGRGDIKVTAYLAGVVVPGFLSGRDLLQAE